ncbi:glycoside hydrolase family 95-like protein [Actinomadura opuntiae]
MLLQSHAGRIRLLPALPAAWPSGRFRGLRARGGLSIDASWHDGRATEFCFSAAHGRSVKLQSPMFSGRFEVVDTTGGRVTVRGEGADRIEIDLLAGHCYRAHPV